MVRVGQAWPEREERRMLASKLRKGIAIGGCALVAAAAAPATSAGGGPRVATATPRAGVRATTLAAGTAAGGIAVTAPGPTEVTVREITIEPGGSTGWHYHLGELLAVVQAGTLTRQLEDCSVETTPAGQAFVEPAGGQHVHVGRNLGTEPVVLYATYVLPTGSPLAVEAPDPGCGG
jgi:quercetin dioxygenase-like cupin family protein